MLALEYVREDGEVECVLISHEGNVVRYLPDYSSLEELDSFTVKVSVTTASDDGAAWFTPIGTIVDNTGSHDNSWTIVDRLLHDPLEVYESFKKQIKEHSGGA